MKNYEKLRTIMKNYENIYIFIDFNLKFLNLILFKNKL
jgi:hypothetical protein